MGTNKIGVNIVRSVKNQHYLNAGASADRGKDAVLSGILQMLFSKIFVLLKSHISLVA